MKFYIPQLYWINTRDTLIDTDYKFSPHHVINNNVKQKKP